MAVEKFIAVHYEDPERRGSHSRVLKAMSLEEIKDKVDRNAVSRDDVTEVEGCSIDDIFGVSEGLKEESSMSRISLGSCKKDYFDLFAKESDNGYRVYAKDWSFGDTFFLGKVKELDKSGIISLLNKSKFVKTSNFSPSYSVGDIQWKLGESLKEEKIADKIRANQDTKEMTKRAIRTIKNLGGQYDDLVKDFIDAYGEDPLEESVLDSSHDRDFYEKAIWESQSDFTEDELIKIFNSVSDKDIDVSDMFVPYSDEEIKEIWSKLRSILEKRISTGSRDVTYGLYELFDLDFEEECLKESSELTDKDWEEFYDLEDELSKIMNSVDSDMDDYQGDIYHNTYDDTLRLHYLTYPSKVNNKWASTLEKKLRDFFEKSTRFTDIDYIDIYRKKDTSPLDLLTYVVDIRAFDPTIGREDESLKESFEGMTIKDWIVDGMTRAAEDRLQKLTDMGAPQVMIDRQSEMVDELKSGKIHITGDLKALDLPLENREIKTGRGGKTYFSINDGKVNYFPYAKYGPYIKMVSREESLKESDPTKSGPIKLDRETFDRMVRDNNLLRGLSDSDFTEVRDYFTRTGYSNKASAVNDLWHGSNLGYPGSWYDELLDKYLPESLKESIDDFIGETFIEDGVEYEWITQYGDELETGTGTWAVWEASPVDSDDDDESPKSFFFVVDVDNGFIDWGPCETVEEAAEFLESKESDEEEDDYDYKDWVDDEYDYDTEYERSRD